MRRIATIRRRTIVTLPRTRHYVGQPPPDGERRLLPLATLVVMMTRAPYEGVFLYRYTDEGKPAGDTWHANIEDAEHQLAFEFGSEVGAWIEVPPEVKDEVDFGLTVLREDRETE